MSKKEKDESEDKEGILYPKDEPKKKEGILDHEYDPEYEPEDSKDIKKLKKVKGAKEAEAKEVEPKEGEPEPVDDTDTRHGTQDSIYGPGNPAVYPGSNDQEVIPEDEAP